MNGYENKYCIHVYVCVCACLAQQADISCMDECQVLSEVLWGTLPSAHGREVGWHNPTCCLLGEGGAGR